jgi:uncharacterized protein involved in outer membrane biogenesis
MTAWTRTLKILLAVVILLLAALAGLLLVLASLDWNKHRDLVVAVVDQYTDWHIETLEDLQIDGLFPTRLRVAGIRLTPKENRSPLASVAMETLAVSVDPLSVLFPESLHVYHFQATGTRIVVRQSARALPPEEAPVLPAIPFIESARMADTVMVYHPAEAEDESESESEQQDRSLKLTINELHAGSQDRDKPLRVALNGMLAPAGHPAGAGHCPDEDSSQPSHFRLAFSLDGSPVNLELRDIQATLGYSHAYGSANWRLDGDKPWVSADLGISKLQLEDFTGLLSMQMGAEGAESGSDVSSPVFSREPLDLALLRRFDMDVQVSIDDGVQGKLGELVSGITADAHLAAGKLTLSVSQTENEAAEDSVTGDVEVDASSAETRADLRLQASRLDLTSLVAPYLQGEETFKAAEVIRGEVTAIVDLHMSGETPHGMVSRLQGELSFAMTDGAIMATLVEALGIDITETAVSWMADNPLTDVQCAVGVFAIENGVIQSRVMLFATEDSSVVGEGSVDLAAETLDFTLETHARDFSILSAESGINIKGPLTKVKVDVVTGELVAKLAGAALMGLVQPALAVIPLLETGVGDQNPCGDYQVTLQNIQRQADSERG